VEFAGTILGQLREFGESSSPAAFMTWYFPGTPGPHTLRERIPIESTTPSRRREASADALLPPGKPL
jgi:hypothetical protein